MQQHKFLFQSTLPVRGATQWRGNGDVHSNRFQSTLPVRGATQRIDQPESHTYISIHAPRAGSDDCPQFDDGRAQYFNPRSPCGERRGWVRVPDSRRNFNPRSPCGERRWFMDMESHNCIISIHAPRAGSDQSTAYMCGLHEHFNPRSPCGERLPTTANGFRVDVISIHAPRAGSDVHYVYSLYR